ncbi:MAG: PilZ domain-containing protein [Thermodesulfobacteriota bacterium]|nr:PilZ domain-containing protein [Thermodesulfobacteriota bacterium]
MTDSIQPPEKPGVMARLRELLKGMQSFLEHAPEDQQESLLSLFEGQGLESLLTDWQQGDPIEVSMQPDPGAVVEGKGDRVLRDFVGHIGTGGMFIETPPTFSVGEEITLVFSPTYEQGPVRVSGKIVWRIPSGIGIKFTSATSDLEEILGAL